MRQGSQIQAAVAGDSVTVIPSQVSGGALLAACLYLLSGGREPPPALRVAAIARHWHIPGRRVADRFLGLEVLGAEDNRRLLRGDPSPLELNAGRLAEAMHGCRLPPGVPPVGGLANPGYLPAA